MGQANPGSPSSERRPSFLDHLHRLLVITVLALMGWAGGVAGSGCWNPKVAQPPPAKAPLTSERPDNMPVGASFPELPTGCEIWAKGASGNEWRTNARMIVMKCPDGDTEIQFMEDGAIEVRTFGQQTVRFAAVTGVRMEVAVP